MICRELIQSWLASETGHTEIVKLLLEKGADVNEKDIKGVSPLGIVLEKGHADIAKLLLENGASLSMQTALFLNTVRKLDAYEINTLTEEQFLEDGWDRGQPAEQVLKQGLDADQAALNGAGIIEFVKNPNNTSQYELGWFVGPEGVALTPPSMRMSRDALRNMPGQVNLKANFHPKFKLKKKVFCSLIFKDGLLAKKLWDEKVQPYTNLKLSGSNTFNSRPK